MEVNALPVPRSVKGRATMQQLLRAARLVLVRDGYAAARVSDISATAGLSNGAFYRYFTDKQQVMLHVIAEFIATSRESVRVPFDPEQPTGSVRASTRRYLEYWAENAPVWWAVLEATQIDPQVDAIHRKEIDDWCKRIAHMLERGAALGVVRDDIDPVTAGYLLGVMTQAYAQHAFRLGSDLDTDPVRVADEVTKIWESGVFKPPGSARRSPS